MRRCLLALALIGCRRPTPATEPPPTGPDTAISVEVTAETAATGDTAATEPTETGPDPDCLVPPPPGPFSFQVSSALATEEDFDFDIDGFLICQRVGSILAMNRQGQTHVISPSGVDAAGIRSLSTGDVVVADPATGSLGLVQYPSGATELILGGITQPNGLEATSDGQILSSEYMGNGRIRLVDPYTGAASLVGTMSWPNNMALSPDEQTVYVVASPDFREGVIAKIERTDTGWSQPEVLYVHDSLLGGITTDKCGNVYAVEFSGGRVFRLAVGSGTSTSGEPTPELIADLNSSGSFSSARFGHGLGGWERTELFVTSRGQMFVIDVGIEGRHVLAVEE
jgi:hypothetical protein